MGLASYALCAECRITNLSTRSDRLLVRSQDGLVQKEVNKLVVIVGWPIEERVKRPED